MKVVQVLPSLRGGGVEKGTLEVGKYLVDNGYESLVVSAGGPLVQQLESEGSRHIEWDLGKKSLFTLRHIWAFRRFLREEKPDILHLRSRMPAWVCWLAWHGMPKHERPRLVTTVHGLYSVSRYSQIMCRGEAVIAVSKTVEDYIAKNYPETPQNRVHLVYRGVDPEEFPHGYEPSSEWREGFFAQFPHTRGKRLLCLPGRLTRLKGHNDFLDLIDVLVREVDDIHAIIVGGEDPKRKDYAEELYRRVEVTGLSETVTFTGARSDIREIFAISDLVYSLSTKPESFGRTVLEALSLGRPVLGYNHGGVGEILSRLFPAGRVEISNATELITRSLECLKDQTSVGRVETFYRSQMLEGTLATYVKLTQAK
ncbi:MAG: glycosyltransferase family 4 protein [Oceanospirillaceae bacterium]|nr:glycosyltransferase family 4 protein [Oceanospirillaceae bacterium]